MESDLIERLGDKTITKEQLLELVQQDFTLLPNVVNGLASPRAAIRYGCGKVLMELSKQYPGSLYPHWDVFVKTLDSKYRILTWQAMFIIANLTKVDINKKFDAIFDRYYQFLHDEYMVTVANIVGHSGTIALAKPYLIPKITQELLKVEQIKLTPHLTEECKRVITEQAIHSFDMFFDKMKNKNEVLSFVKKQTKSSRKTLKKAAEEFLQKWDT